MHLRKEKSGAAQPPLISLFTRTGLVILSAAKDLAAILLLTINTKKPTAGSAAKNRKLNEVNLAAILLLTINTKKSTAGSVAKNRKLDEVNLAAILLLTINTHKPTAGSAAKDLLVKVNSKFEYRSTKRIKIRTNKAKPEIGKHNGLGWHP